MPADDKFAPDNVQFEVRVMESFRGTPEKGEIVRIRTGFGGGDCGYRFTVGSKYLIDAWGKNGLFVSGICSLTARVEDSEVELRSLRRLAGRQRPPDLVGVLMRGTENNEGERLTPLPSVSVTVTSDATKVTEATATDALGSFAFEKVPDGTYNLILGLPSDLSPAYTNFAILDEDRLPPVSINSNDGQIAACHFQIVVESAGSISGLVQSSDGLPIDGWVNADTVDQKDQPWNTVRTATPRPDGKFFLRNLKPGRYSVQFTNRAGFVTGRRQIIELKAGERRAGVVLLSHP